MAESRKPIIAELSIEFVVELLLFLYPYGAEQMNLPHNFWLGLGCWIGGAVIGIRMFWIFPLWAQRLTKLEKGLIIAILLAAFVSTFYKPVMTAYGKRNGEAEAKPKEQLLPENTPKKMPPPATVEPPIVKPIPATKPQKHPSVTESNPIPTPSQNAPGGINIGRDNNGTAIVNNGPPPPRLISSNETDTENRDGTYTATCVLQIESEIAPGHLVLQVNTEGLLSVGLIPHVEGNEGGASIMLNDVRQGAGFYSATINGPSGRYDLTVTRSRKTRINIGASFK